MTLTRKMLDAMGIEQAKIDQIIESHAETVEALKAKAEGYRADAEKVPALEGKIEELEQAKPTKDWEAEYNKLASQFEEYKEQVSEEEMSRARENAYRDILRELGIDGKRLDAIVKVTDLSGIEFEDGKVKDSEKLVEAARDEWEAFIPQTATQGASVPTPPDGGSGNSADPGTVKRLQERHESLYGKGDN